MTTNENGSEMDNAETPEPIAPAVPEAFRVHNVSSANWLVRRIVESRAYGTHVRTWAAAEIRRAENEERFFFQRFGPQLEAWAREYLRISNGHRRSIPLPSGTIGFRAVAAHLIVTDETKLLAWCHMHLPTAISVEVRVAGSDARRLIDWLRHNCPKAEFEQNTVKSLVDDHFRATGECPMGTECATGERFFVK